MSTSPADQVEHLDAIDHLRRNGFSPLLAALEHPETYTSTGRVILAEIARRLQITPKRAGAMLLQARLVLQ
jgi:DNA-binding CsgD family transcriptional regulator